MDKYEGQPQIKRLADLKDAQGWGWGWGPGRCMGLERWSVMSIEGLEWGVRMQMRSIIRSVIKHQDQRRFPLPPSFLSPLLSRLTRTHCHGTATGPEVRDAADG